MTVVICSVGRHSLRGTLTALAGGDCRALAEVILVDNSATGLRVDPDVGRALPIRVVTGDSRLSVARNLGLAVAGTDVVACTDDDCVPAVDWVLQMALHLERSSRSAAVFGRVVPAYRPGVRIQETTIPGLGTTAWAESTVDGQWWCPAVSAPSWPAGPAARPTVPWAIVGSSNNLGLRRSRLLTGRPPFAVEFGAGTAALSAEDTEFGYAHLAGGRRVDHGHGPVVTHDRWLGPVEAADLSQRYITGNTRVLQALAGRGDPRAARLLAGYRRFLSAGQAAPTNEWSWLYGPEATGTTGGR